MATSQTPGQTAPASPSGEVGLEQLIGPIPGSGEPATAPQTPQTGPGSQRPQAVATKEAEAAAVAEEPEVGESQQEVEGTEGEAPTEEVEAAEFEESDLFPQEGETDYSDAVYARFADHLKRTKGFEFDLKNPKDRFALKEIIDRGNALRQQREAQAATEEEEAERETEEAKPQQAQPQQQSQVSAEQVQQLLQIADQTAQAMLRPEVADAFTEETMKAWKIEDPKQRAVAWTKAMTKFGLLLVNDALQNLFVPKLPEVLNADPVMARVYASAIREEALDRVQAMTEKQTGKPLYSDLEELINSGAIEKAKRENPDIQSAQYQDARTGKPLGPIENQMRRIVLLAKLARGERVNPELMKQAVQKGKQQVKKAQAVAAASKLAPGESKGAFQTQTPEDRMKDGLFGGGSSEWEKEFDKAREETRQRMSR